ncbi:MAG: hypothetical protein AAF675_20450 [Pseudomonadota bacterium]
MEQVNDARSRIGQGLLGAAGANLAGTWAQRGAVATLARVEVSAGARSALLGRFWSFVLPLAPVTAFLLLNLMRVFPSTGEIHPAAYAGIGMTLWLFMQELLLNPSASIVRYRGLVGPMRFPLLAAVVAGLVPVLRDLAIRLVVVLPIAGALSGLSPLGCMLLLPALLPVMALMGAGGLVLALLAFLADDFARLTGLLMRYVLFVSFAVFPLPLVEAHPLAQVLYYANPFALYIDNLRSLLVLGTLASPLAFVLLSAFSLTAFVLALGLVHRLEPRLRYGLLT